MRNQKTEERGTKCRETQRRKHLMRVDVPIKGTPGDSEDKPGSEDPAGRCQEGESTSPHGCELQRKFTATLYNLSDDIAEEKNLAASHGETTKALSDLLEQWESETSKTAVPFVAAPREKK